MVVDFLNSAVLACESLAAVALLLMVRMPAKFDHPRGSCATCVKTVGFQASKAQRRRCSKLARP